MQAYNTTQPALPVYSQQFAGCMHSYRDGIFNVLSYELIRRIDGPNDGLVTLESAAFDNFCGELTTAAGKGITHAGLVDVLKRPFTPKRHRQRRESAQGQTQVQRRESTQSQTQAGQQGEELAQAHEQSQAQAQSQTQSQTQGAQQIPLQVDDILDFYVALVANLKAWGY